MATDTEIAAALAAAASTVAAGMSGFQLAALETLVRSLIQPGIERSDPLAGVMASMSAEARAAGLSDDDIDAELAVYNSERRS